MSCCRAILWPLTRRRISQRHLRIDIGNFLSASSACPDLLILQKMLQFVVGSSVPWIRSGQVEKGKLRMRGSALLCPMSFPLWDGSAAGPNLIRSNQSSIKSLTRLAARVAVPKMLESARKVRPGCWEWCASIRSMLFHYRISMDLSIGQTNFIVAFEEQLNVSRATIQ